MGEEVLLNQSGDAPVSWTAPFFSSFYIFPRSVVLENITYAKRPKVDFLFLPPTCYQTRNMSKSRRDGWESG